MPKRKRRGCGRRSNEGKRTGGGPRKAVKRVNPAGLFEKPGRGGRKVVRYTHPGKRGWFGRKVRGSKRLVLYTRPKPKGGKARAVASDAVTAREWRELLKHDPEQLTFRKKGRKIQVRVRKGAGVAIVELPARKGMAREVKARLRLAGGKRRVRDIKKVKLSPGREWELLALYPTHADMTFWSREVYRSRQGVGIGQPIGTKSHYWGRLEAAKTGHELSRAFEKIRPLSWDAMVERVPDWFRQREAAVGVRMKVMDAEGKLHDISTGTQWLLEDMTDPQRGYALLRGMLAAALMQAGRRFGYFGNTRVLSVGLLLAVRREGASLPVSYGQPVQFGEEE